MLNKVLGLVKDSATYGASYMLGQVISFFLLPLYTRYLSADDYGVIAMLGILSVLFVPLANLGISNAIFRRYNVTKDPGERRIVLGTGLIAVVAASVALLAIGLVFNQQLSLIFTNDIKYAEMVSLSLYTAALTNIRNVPTIILRANRQVKIYSVLNLIGLVISILLTVYMVVGLSMGLEGFIWANLISTAIATVIPFWFCWKSVELKLNMLALRQMLDYGLPFLPHRLLSFGIAQFGQYMVGNMLGLDQAGLYSIAIKLTMPLSLVVGAIQTSWVPYKFQIHANDADPVAFFRSVNTYYVAVTSYLWLGVSIWGPEVLRLMTPSDFHQAAILIPFIGWIQIGQGLYYMFGTGIELGNNTKPMPLVSAAGLIAVVTTAFLFVPWFGALGAALATNLGWLVMSFVIYKLSQRQMRIDYDWPAVLAISGLSVAFVTGGLLVQDLGLAVRLATAFGLSVLFPIGVLAFLFRSQVEKERVIELLRVAKKKFPFLRWMPS